ncbi:MAG: iron-sulfur cluster repair di-iron protein [Candidatus Marinimicrobia bacterium]|nr:iron-sulfur cluster repair di-iron protein [Candidatus Neomarinimicrobiota bacterium]MCF7829280.1 iron-sulfur cluster repair di-iron protein [Candidatus Neomarinimicrobiota bacterium]MCF7881067.1 iron-sulfur cluster repair di-iron protein [Candidatus Neomarinimicrobiota bacterium]
MYTIEKEQGNTALEKRTVGEIVADDYRTAEVFQRHRIDFCCGGNKPLREACEEKNVNVQTVVGDLEQIHDSGGVTENYNEWAPDFLADYIVNQHHAYARQVIPQLNAFAEKVARVHGDRHPETREIAEIWLETGGNMITHMQREELVLFPYIKRLSSADGEGSKAKSPTFDSAEKFIAELEDDHNVVGDSLAKLKSLSSGFTPPQGACNTYRGLYASLQEFAAKTKEHIHLENNILFPKAIRFANASSEAVME